MAIELSQDLIEQLHCTAENGYGIMFTDLAPYFATNDYLDARPENENDVSAWRFTLALLILAAEDELSPYLEL